MAIDPKRGKEIFLEAAELPDEAARAVYLDKACGADAGVREWVEALLRSHDPECSFLGTPAAVVPDPDHAATQALTGTPEPGVASSRTASDEPGSSDDEPLTFLAPPTRPDSLGRLGHYEVLQVLGRGGFGIVFRALDETLQRVVAVKVLAPHLAATSPARKRFVREARSSAQVRHENIVQVYAVEEQPLPYLVMEFIPGETLQQRLDRIGPFEALEVAQIGRQIAEGLAAAHGTGLIHRDIKPHNILIEAGPHEHVKITDFGLARAADDASMTQSGMVVGTPMYMAPEQAQGDPLDHRADLFSLGSVLYAICTGRPPFRANSTLAVLKRVAEDSPRPIPEIIPETPPWLSEIITRLHAKKPQDRFATAREVADRLGLGLAAMQRPGTVPSLPDVPPAAEGKLPAVREIPEVTSAIRPRSRTYRWAVAAAVLLLFVGGLGFAEVTGVTNFRGTIIRLFSPEGTLVVEVDDPGVSIKIDGSDLVITGAGAKEVRLKPGKYTVEATKNGKLVSRELITVTQKGRQIVRVSQEPPPDAKAAKEGKEAPPAVEAKNLDPDRRAAEHVLSFHAGPGQANVQVNGQEPRITAVANLPREPFNLTVIDLFNKTQVADVDLAHFKDCKSLTFVSVVGTRVTDAGLANFKDCRNLVVIGLARTQVGDAGLAHLADCKKLEQLHLQETQVSDAGLAKFKDFENLTMIFLVGTKVSDVGVAHLEGCKNLTWLSLDGTKVGDKGLAHLEQCKKLTHLELGDTQVSDAGLAHLEGLENLVFLTLHHTKVTAKGIEKLKQALPKCEIWGPTVPVTPPAPTSPDIWSKALDLLPLDKQGAALAVKLQERLPGFEGAFLKAIPALPADRQGIRVAAWRKERNPSIDGKGEHRIENGVMTELFFEVKNVTDLAPVRARRGLQVRACTNGLLSDLSPLKGLPLAAPSDRACTQVWGRSKA